MSDTLGGLADKLGIVNLKMWNNQELLYELRRMTFEQFKEKYLSSDEAGRGLFECLKKCCDLNVQRNDLIDEIDDLFLKTLANVAVNGVDADLEHLSQKKHKSY